MSDLAALSKEWITLKKMEAQTAEARRAVEDKISALLEIPDTWEGATTMQEEKVKIQIRRSFSRRINGDKLQDIAATKGLTNHLSVLFRWKPEINMKLWNAADEKIKTALSGAIITTPGRPNYKIEEVEE